MSPAPPRLLPASQEQGFSLIEAAIVLGVVGLVMGGIWVAASTVTDKLKWSRTETGMSYLVEQAMRDLSADTVSAVPSDADTMQWFKNRLSPPSGWTTSQWQPSILTYRMHDPLGYAMYITHSMYGAIPTVMVGYISPMYNSPGSTLERLHCARIYALFKSIGNRYPVARWAGVPGGCSPNTLNTVADFYDSTCCPGRPIAQFTAQRK